MEKMEEISNRGNSRHNIPYIRRLTILTCQKVSQTTGHQKIAKIETEGISLRLDSRILDGLKQEAKLKQVSTNILASQIFKQHLDWHTNAAKAGFIAVRRGMLTKLLEKISEEEAMDVAKFVAKNESRDFVLFMRNEYDMDAAMEVVETWLRISGYPYTHRVKFGRHSYVIQHDMGRKWSIYLSEVYRFIFEDFGQKNARLNFTENTLHIQFEEI